MKTFVKLKAKSRHGKNRINMHGELWRVDKIVDDPRMGQGFIRSSNAPGPWLWLESVSCDCPVCQKWGQDGRWISERQDENFEIVEWIENGS